MGDDRRYQIIHSIREYYYLAISTKAKCGSFCMHGVDDIYHPPMLYSVIKKKSTTQKKSNRFRHVPIMFQKQFSVKSCNRLTAYTYTFMNCAAELDQNSRA